MAIKEESWDLTSGDTAAIPAANRADGTANKWSDIWKYQVPTGQSHLLRPEYYIAMHGMDTSPAEVGNGTCQAKVLVRDQSEQDEKCIFGPALYISLKEFQDREKMAKLTLKEDLVVDEKYFVVLSVKDDATFDESASYFKLQTTRFRPGL